MGPQILSIELQEPTDHMVLGEWSGIHESGATMRLGWDLALELIDYTASDRQTAVARARQQPDLIRQMDGNRETRLVNRDVRDFLDATGLDVADELAVEDGRFYVGVVTVGDGTIEGDFGPLFIRRG
jgi:hypothetical protein